MKWGREKFEGVEVNTDDAPAVFKSQLFSLSGWPLRTAYVALIFNNRGPPAL